MSKLFFQTSTVSDGNMSRRFGDEAEVVKNQQEWLTSSGMELEQLCLMRCDHGEKIVRVMEENFFASMRPEAEVLMTNQSGIVLGLLTADCIPAVFHDPAHQAIALAHLNRRTVAHDLAQKTLQAMEEEFSAQPADLVVYFEPHIHAASYSFPLPFTDPTPPQLTDFIIEKSGYGQVDFAAAHTQQLIEVGVPRENITVSPIDVYTSPDYFSHHATKTETEKPAGRHLTVVGIQ